VTGSGGAGAALATGSDGETDDSTSPLVVVRRETAIGASVAEATGGAMCNGVTTAGSAGGSVDSILCKSSPWRTSFHPIPPKTTRSAPAASA
jgi:hypothetical protein